MNNENTNLENEFPEIREKLKNLPRLRASDNFVKNLQLKIDLHDAGSEKLSARTEKLQQSFFKNIFGAGWVMPAAGITVAAAIAVSIIFWNRTPDTITTPQFSKNTPEVIQEGSGNTESKNNVTPDVTNEKAKENTKETNPINSKDFSSADLNSNNKNMKSETPEKLSETPMKTPVNTQVTTPKVTDKITSKDIDNSGRVSTSFVTEEKSSPKNSDSDDAIRRKLQMGNARGGDTKGIPPSSPPSSKDLQSSVNENSKIMASPIKKSVKDVIDISKTSLESLKDKIK
ncbi:hypothetical protein BH10BAC5_BH10BAC5_21230 [soil metagenome]